MYCDFQELMRDLRTETIVRSIRTPISTIHASTVTERLKLTTRFGFPGTLEAAIRTVQLTTSPPAAEPVYSLIRFPLNAQVRTHRHEITYQIAGCLAGNADYVNQRSALAPTQGSYQKSPLARRYK